MRVIGAGVGRTGTNSLKVAVEHLIGGTCYHGYELLAHPEHTDQWAAAAAGELVDLPGMLGSYTAVLDWPAAAFWPELTASWPDAIVILSTRDPDAWWRSASSTIFRGIDVNGTD